MTVSTENSQKEYLGNGIATSFPCEFAIFSEDDLLVVEIDTGGAESTLVKGVDYTVTNVGVDSLAVVVLTDPLTSDHRLIISRMMEFLQPVDVRNAGTFQQEVHESAWDRLCMLIQQLNRYLSSGDVDLSRCLQLGPYDVIGDGSYRALSNRIQDLDDPVDDQDAVTKAWVRTNYGSGLGEQLPYYTSMPNQATLATLARKAFIVKEAGLPAEIFVSCLDKDDVEYEAIPCGQGKAW